MFYRSTLDGSRVVYNNLTRHSLFAWSLDGRRVHACDKLITPNLLFSNKVAVRLSFRQHTSSKFMPKSIVTTPSLNVLPFWPEGNIALTTWHRQLTRRTVTQNPHFFCTESLLLAFIYIKLKAINGREKNRYFYALHVLFLCWRLVASRLANMKFLRGTLIGVRLHHWDAPVGYHTIGHLHMTHIMCPYKTTCQRLFGTFVKAGGQPAKPPFITVCMPASGETRDFQSELGSSSHRA